MRKIILLISVFFTLFGISNANEVNIFSARHYDSDVQLYEKFTAKTGIKVNVVSGKDKALQKRIIEEGKDSVADLYITADAGRLGAFQEKGMFQRASSSALTSPLILASMITLSFSTISPSTETSDKSTDVLVSLI